MVVREARRDCGNRANGQEAIQSVHAAGDSKNEHVFDEGGGGMRSGSQSFVLAMTNRYAC